MLQMMAKNVADQVTSGFCTAVNALIAVVLRERLLFYEITTAGA